MAVGGGSCARHEGRRPIVLITRAIPCQLFSPDQLPQPLTSHPIAIAIEIAVPLPQQLLGPGKRTDLLAAGLGPYGLGRLRASAGRA